MTTWIINEMTYLVLFGEVRSLLRTSDFTERQDQIHHSLIIHVFTSGLGNWNLLLAAAKYCVFQWGHKISFFPSIANFLVEFGCVYASIPKYRHYDIAYCYIIVPNKSSSSSVEVLLQKLKNTHCVIRNLCAVDARKPLFFRLWNSKSI